MQDSAIHIEGVGKRYRLGQRGASYATVRDALTTVLSGRLRRRRGESERAAHIWALRNVSLDIARGDVVGIVGANGAGKSTLLKLLSRITEPTEGMFSLCGRVGSLLEVGTGFHPELTGRENIYLNGAILGMHRKEIQANFDSILAFAEVERFVDTPVKFYSSGMYVRLAFAVAAHLEPDILLVDEVLAVGDLKFQKKCIGRMEEIGREGRTVLFVSHQMDAVRSLCAKAVWLDDGGIRETGSAGDVVAHYERHALERAGSSDGLFLRKGTTSVSHPWIKQVEVLHAERGRTTLFGYGESVVFKILVSDDQHQSVAGSYLLLRLSDESGRHVSTCDTLGPGFEVPSRTATINCTLGPLPLMAQKYTVEIGYGVLGHGRLDTWSGDVFIEVTSCDPYKTGITFDRRSGVTFIPATWAEVS